MSSGQEEGRAWGVTTIDYRPNKISWHQVKHWKENLILRNATFHSPSTHGSVVLHWAEVHNYSGYGMSMSITKQELVGSTTTDQAIQGLKSMDTILGLLHLGRKQTEGRSVPALILSTLPATDRNVLDNTGRSEHHAGLEETTPFPNIP